MTRARCTGATCTGCQWRFNTRVDRCSTQPLMGCDLSDLAVAAPVVLSLARERQEPPRLVILTNGKGMMPGRLGGATLSFPRAAGGGSGREFPFRTGQWPGLD